MAAITLYISANLYYLANIDIPNQNYNFTFMINDKPDDLNITLLIDGSPIIVPFECRREFSTLYNFF